MLTLLDDPDLRQRTAAVGVARAASLLRWDDERKRLLAAYDLVLAPPAPATVRPVTASTRGEAGLDRAPAV
jgi:hypothetical protein